MNRTRRYSLHRARAVVAAALLAITGSVFASGGALAAGNAACNAPYQNSHAGSNRSGATAGAEASIGSFTPLLCTTSSTDGLAGSFSYVSVEVSTGGNAIVQIGIGKCIYSYLACDGNYRLFYAWGREAGVGSCSTTRSAVPQSLGLAPTGTHKYTVYRTATQVVFQKDGVTQTTIAISNVSCWSGTNMTAVGETWDHGDQMGGLVGTAQHFTSALYEGSVGGQWLSPSFTTCSSDVPGIYMCSRINGQAVDIWTDRS